MWTDPKTLITPDSPQVDYPAYSWLKSDFIFLENCFLDGPPPPDMIKMSFLWVVCSCRSDEGGQNLVSCNIGHIHLYIVAIVI